MSNTMRGRSTDWLLALAAGTLLAVMIDQNSLMAKQRNPIFASWIAHGIGSAAALFLAVVFSGIAYPATKDNKCQRPNGPAWAYLGGIPGALTVVLAAITVNSRLALPGSLALMLVGQLLFGIVVDYRGLLGVPKRDLMINDLFAALSVIAGSGILIFWRS